MKSFGSIRDVAKETGLSTATVSRVMNGATNVSPKTRERVLNACKKLDYLPNPAARALSTNRSRTIAAIIPTIEHSVFAKYIAAIEQTLDQRNYALVMAISNADHDLELNEARKLLGMGADAFILSGADHREELINLLNRRKVPHVLTSVWEPDNESPTIGYDNHSLAKQAIEYLAGRGHERIAIVHGPLAASDRTRARKSGALAADHMLADLKFFETELTVEGGKHSARAIATTEIPFTAILCFSDVLALGAYFSLQEASIDIPSQISIMGFDNLDWSSQVVPPLTTINLPASRMGREVARQLISHLDDGLPIRKTLLPGEIIERESVAGV